MAPALTAVEDLSSQTIAPIPVTKGQQPVVDDVPHAVKPMFLNPSSLAPPKRWQAMCHPLEPQTTEEVDGWFLKNWGFPDAAAERKFVAAGFSRVTCLYFPLSHNDRIHHACRLLTILFLIDDILDDMSFEEGEKYNNDLMPIMRGEVQANPDRPVEWMTQVIWDDMRAHDYKLATETLEPTFTFMRAQTDRNRSAMRNLGQYLIYRERDVGKALLSALMKFCMALNLTPEEAQTVVPFERNCAKQISIVNDVCSYEKEVMAAKEGHVEGAALCSAVGILADETDLSISASKRVLWAMAREWEKRHDAHLAALEKRPEGCSQNIRDYLKGLEYQMSGNEEWSLSTLRYIDVPLWEEPAEVSRW